MRVNQDAGAIADRLAEIVRTRAKPEVGAWLLAQRANAGRAEGRTEFLSAFASAGRRLGTSPVVLGQDAAALGEAATQQLEGRSLDEVGRVALLLAASTAMPEPEQPAFVADLFHKGGAGEKQAILRALPLLPAPARFLEVALEACRSSVQTIFDAIACDNPYPAEQFSELAFNQMVLKSLFNGVRCARIVGLEQRAGPELLRMVDGYAAERRAAGRSVPEDIESIRALTRSHR